MTAHELAKILLDMPDNEVAFWQYTGGDDELMEVKSVKIEPDGYYPYVVLYNYNKV